MGQMRPLGAIVCNTESPKTQAECLQERPMPTITPGTLRNLAQNLASDGRLTRADVDQIIDKAMEADAITPELKAELSEVLETFSDRMEGEEPARRLSAFLASPDRDLRALAHRLERDDGVIDTADADALVNLANQDGRITGDEKYSLAAVMVGARMTGDARDRLSGIATEDLRVSGGSGIAIPDNDPGGVSDVARVDADGMVAGVTVDLDLKHTYRGDLRVSLVAPDGTRVALHNRSGRGDNDIRGNYPGTLQPAEDLSALLGKGAQGDWRLEVIDEAGQDVGTIESWRLNLKVGKKETTPTGDAKNMDPSGTHRPVFVSPTGHFVLDPSVDVPADAAARGDGLFRMAELVDDAKTNPFRQGHLTLDDKERVQATLAESLAMVPPAGTQPTTLAELQALQMRSSALTVMREMMASLGNSGAEGDLKRALYGQYTAALAAETNPVLKDSLTYHLHFVAEGLPSDLKVEADAIHKSIAPTQPPYAEWFKDGNTTLNRWRRAHRTHHHLVQLQFHFRRDGR
jgi:subtilisin-like proprotein convertase family protein